MSLSGIEIRFNFKLPATNGRKISGMKASNLVENNLTQVANNIRFSEIPEARLKKHIETYLDQQELRQKMQENSNFLLKIII